jgi:hypothetical protein
VIKLDLWEIINTRVPEERDIPESLEKPEKPVGDEAKASKAKNGRNRSKAGSSQRWNRD